MLRFIVSFIGGIFTWLTLGLFMAAFSVGAVLWIYGRDLPDHAQLEDYRPPTLSRIYSAEGRIIDEFAEEVRIYAPYEDIPELVRNAFISAEDKNFYEHDGFDLRGIAAAVYEAAETRLESVRGASTIPQQVAKILFFSGDRNVERKIKEIIMSNRMISDLGREKVLEIYLNEIDLGARSFGVAAAARTYFNKTLAQLSPAEAAFLAVHPKAPYSYHPVKNREKALERRDFVLREMYQNGYISREEYAVAQADELKTVQGGDFERFAKQLPPRNYFSDQIRRQLSGDFGRDQFFGGGFTIRATLDPEMQDEAAKTLRKALERYDRDQGQWRGTGVTIPADQLGDAPKWRAALREADVPRDIEGWYPAVVLRLGDTSAQIGIESVADDEDGHFIAPKDLGWIRGASVASDVLNVGDVVHVRRMTSDSDGSFIRWTLRQIPEVQGGFMAMDVNSGRVIAMQGGFSYQHSEFNRAAQATRQPGSSFKPFVYAAALDSGFTPATILVDAPIEVDVGGGEVWRPRNASNQFYGPTPLRTGIERSRNLMTVRLAEEIGMDTVAAYAERFGVYDRMGRFLANSLGSEETTLYKMVAAYAMFANGGERVEPTLVDRVQDRWGQTIYRHDQRNCETCLDRDIAEDRSPRISSDRGRVMDPITAYQLTSMMKGVVDRGTASGTVNLPVPTAGKTGTTNEARDVWFVGFTSNIVAGCYIGYDRPKPLGKGATGGGMCGPVFNDFMLKATAKYGGGPFKVPSGGRFIKIDRFSGQRLPDSMSGPNVVAEYFRAGEEPVFGLMYDGGFAMGSNLPMFLPEDNPIPETNTVRNATGEVIKVPTRANIGTISSGGLY